MFSAYGKICGFKETEIRPFITRRNEVVQCEAVCKRGFQLKMYRFDPALWTLHPRAPVVQCLPEPLPEGAPCYILDKLTDDSLLDILGHSIIAEDDLREVGRVCKRFKYLATNIYRTKHRPKPINFDFNDNMNLWEFEAQLRVWGVHIESIRDTSTQSVDITFAMIAKYCPNLVTLHSNSFDLTEPAYLALLKKVQGLVLQPLGLAQCTYSGLEFCEVKLPKLTSLTMFDSWLHSQEATEKFFECNDQLTELVFHKAKLVFGVECFISKLPLLETLIMEFDAICNDYSCFEQLTQLKKVSLQDPIPQVPKKNVPVKVFIAPKEMFTALGAVTTLEHVTLRRYTYPPGLIEAMTKFEQLETLEFFETSGLQDIHLIQMMDRLTQLKDLRLSSHDDWLTIEGFRTMLKMENNLRRVILELRPGSAKELYKTNKTSIEDIAVIGLMKSIQIDIVVMDSFIEVNRSYQ